MYNLGIQWSSLLSSPVITLNPSAKEMLSPSSDNGFLKGSLTFVCSGCFSVVQILGSYRRMEWRRNEVFHVSNSLQYRMLWTDYQVAFSCCDHNQSGGRVYLAFTPLLKKSRWETQGRGKRYHGETLLTGFALHGLFSCPGLAVPPMGWAYSHQLLIIIIMPYGLAYRQSGWRHFLNWGSSSQMTKKYQAD